MGYHKIYDRDFRIAAVRLGHETNFFRAAKDLGVAITNIYRWRDEIQKKGAESFSGRNPERKRIAELKTALKRKLKRVRLHVEILRSASEYISQGKPAIFHFIENNLHKYSLWSMCEVLHIRTQTYERWRKNVISPKQHQTILLEKEITSIFYEFKERYGNGKISAELKSRGIDLSSAGVSYYLKRLGLISKLSSKYKIRSSSMLVSYNPCIWTNVLNRQCQADKPSQVWVSDKVGLRTAEGLLFLTIVMDLFDRKIIGYSVSDCLKVKKTALPALEMAVQNREVKSGLIFHSNRSPQYANKEFAARLKTYKNITLSMSRTGDQLDNPMPRIFFNSLKSVLVNLRTIFTKKQMEEKIVEYIGINR